MSFSIFAFNRPANIKTELTNSITNAILFDATENICEL
jgi:hypothetical protein